MKRVDLTPEQLEDVVRLRQSGLSWLRIDEETKISRRVVQRAYEEWERARSVRELENVRVKVGETEFEGHLDALSRLAEAIIDYLSIPDYRSFTTGTIINFYFLMERDFTKSSSEESPEGSDEKAKARNTRRNKLLLESLKEHTADVIRWDGLTNWWDGWDICSRASPGMMEKTGQVVRSTFGEIVDFDDLFVTGPQQNKPLLILEEGIRDVLWKAIAAGEVNAPAGPILAETVDLKGEETLRITVGARSLHQRANRDMDPSVVDYCRRVLNELWASDETTIMRSGIERMRGITEAFEAELERPVLRPHILKTRCRICPA